MYLYIELNHKDVRTFSRCIESSEEAIRFFKTRMENRISFCNDTNESFMKDESYNEDIGEMSFHFKSYSFNVTGKMREISKRDSDISI